MKNPIYCSTSTLGYAGGGAWYDLEAGMEIAPQVECDGFEFRIHSEWQRGQLKDGTPIPGYKYHQIFDLVKQSPVKFRAIHAQEDICAFLDQNDGDSQTRGLVLLEEAYDLANELGVEYIVFHSWYLKNPLQSFERISPFIEGFKEVGVPLSIETIPSPGNEDFCRRVVDFLPPNWGLTLDLYHTHEEEVFEHWLQYARWFTNIHVQCYIDEEGGEVHLQRNRRGPIDIMQRLRRVLAAGYQGPLTLEPNGKYTLDLLNRALRMLRQLQK